MSHFHSNLNTSELEHQQAKENKENAEENDNTEQNDSAKEKDNAEQNDSAKENDNAEQNDSAGESNNLELNSNAGKIENEKKARKERRKKLPQNKQENLLFDHFAVHDKKKSNSRCKNGNCVQKTHWRCEKCEAYFCLTKNRNCFYAYHHRSQ